jgi:hypothetical protein
MFSIQFRFKKLKLKKNNRKNVRNKKIDLIWNCSKTNSFSIYCTFAQ